MLTISEVKQSKEQLREAIHEAIKIFEADNLGTRVKIDHSLATQELYNGRKHTAHRIEVTVTVE